MQLAPSATGLARERERIRMPCEARASRAGGDAAWHGGLGNALSCLRERAGGTRPVAGTRGRRAALHGPHATQWRRSTR